jgi:hypothetical protein
MLGDAEPPAQPRPNGRLRNAGPFRRGTGAWLSCNPVVRECREARWVHRTAINAQSPPVETFGGDCFAGSGADPINSDE